ncbi:degenerin mec-10-like [Centruroides sculpturatus]|uniref:degenerin mec-10-like n=1 Tax=Centruroides sculpturatus TaxID=218467 RepID=UPI000C6C978F|nr:degenerin mec-10-like [Centruroides sculpturatus]XP_023234270.1 degenerin mec-10-like [Centruroides sculpturatus]
MDNNTNETRNKSTCKEKGIYFLKLLEDVQLTGIPQIVTATDKRRKVFKIIVFCTCLAGFLYHLISFVLLFLTYPSTLEVLVTFKDTNDLPKPVLTICDLNGIRRTSFCNELPEDCEKPKNMKVLCERFEYFCEDNDTDNLVFPIHNSLRAAEFFRQTVDRYGPTAEDMLETYSDIATPIFYTNTYGMLRKCYSIDLSELHELHYLFSYDKLSSFLTSGEVIATIFLTFNPKESSNPAAAIGAKVSVHNKDQLVNPFVDGFRVKPGRIYNLQLKAIEENLLDSPYGTNCTRYEQLIDRGISGSYSRDFCIIECKKELWLKECNCVFGEYNLDFTGNFCDKVEEYKCIRDVDEDECYNKCKKSCELRYFEYEIDQLEIEQYHVENFTWDKNDDWWNNERIWYSTISVYYKRPEILIYKYKPQYELIEFFSYIGGYIGIWLGISLIAVFDFLEMLFVFCCCVIKGKIPIKREKKSNVLLQNDTNV